MRLGSLQRGRIVRCVGAAIRSATAVSASRYRCVTERAGAVRLLRVVMRGRLQVRRIAGLALVSDVVGRRWKRRPGVVGRVDCCERRMG